MTADRPSSPRTSIKTRSSWTRCHRLEARLSVCAVFNNRWSAEGCDIWPIATLTFPPFLVQLPRGFSGSSPRFTDGHFTSFVLGGKKIKWPTCRNAKCDHISSRKLHFSYYSLILCAKAVVVDDPRVADKTVVVSAWAWALGDLRRLSSDCYFIPTVAELSGFWSAVPFSSASSRTPVKLQQGSLNPRFSCRGGETTDCIHKRWLPRRCLLPDLRIQRVWRCWHPVDVGGRDAHWGCS